MRTHLRLPQEIHALDGSGPRTATRSCGGRGVLREGPLVSVLPLGLGSAEAAQIITGRLRPGARLPDGQLPLVVVGVVHLLRTVREVPQDADAVLDALVVDVGLLDGLAHEVDEGVDEALALAQLLAAVVAGRAHVPERAVMRMNNRGKPGVGLSFLLHVCASRPSSGNQSWIC